MSLKPDDPSAGFQHNNVVAFINEKMAGHTKGPEFYLENISLSWEEVENKLRAILEDSAVPSEAKDACAWSSLALGVRFARRQSQLHGRRVHWLQNFTKLHKSAAQTLASDLKELTAQQEMERKESVFRLWQTQANLAEMGKERDLLRWKVFRAELESPRKQEQVQVAEEPGLATASGVETEGAREEEEEAGAAATSATAAGATGRGRRSQKDAEGAEATKKLGRGPVHLHGAEEQKNYTSGGQREGDLRSVETTVFYFSGTMKPGSRVTSSPLPVQLPASFTHSYSCPSSPFPPAPAPSPPAATFTAGAPSQTSPHQQPSDVSSWSDGGSQGTNPQESQRDRRDSEPHQQRRPPIFHRPGDWDCPWCKAVNCSQREICFRCGRGIWLQSPK
ncbi:testis-expressed protein 13A [Mirounga leonina]|uniref:testis-expressed protein 13A n=1 Tax=Mirounga leonina TaxID=9715 RepID=UPI00156BF4A8|nr:testis-expressed protein 13A [Mirounga leonina]KAF3813107.1 hypothetical protein GH733_018945 [Mirounga leonina]